MTKQFLFSFAFLLFWSTGFGQSEWVNRASEELGSFKQNYLYPSVLRALNGVDDSGNFTSLIKDIRYVRVLRIDSVFIAENPDLISEFYPALQKEGFEDIAEWKSKGNSNRMLLVKEKKEHIRGFLAYEKGRNALLIIEIVGNFHIKNLKDLMKIDFETLSGFAGLDDIL